MRLFRQRGDRPDAPFQRGDLRSARDPGARPLLCDVTVLFADLEGFTALAERLPPHEVVATLNETFAEISDCVLGEGGIVNKFIGDAVLVYWTSGDGQADARAASRAALAVVSRMAVLQERRLEEGKRPIKVRIGISSGPAILGDIGAAGHFDRTVIGDPVNLASRLESLNKQFQTDILVSGATRGRLGDVFCVRDLGKVPIKGRREPVEVFALLDPASSR